MPQPRTSPWCRCRRCRSDAATPDPTSLRRLVYLLLITVAFITPLFLAASGRGWPLLLPLLATPLAWPLVARVRSFTEPRQLNPVLKGTARLTLVHALLFGAGLTLSGALA